MLVIISAGQDALFDDPKGGMTLFPADYGTLTSMLRDATDHSLALVLEGGYGPSHGEAVRQIFTSLMDLLFHLVRLNRIALPAISSRHSKR